MTVKRLLLLACLFLVFLHADPLLASQPFSVEDTSYFFEFDTRPFLVEPGFVETGPNGEVAVWDEGLQQYFFLGASTLRRTDTRIVGGDTVVRTSFPDSGQYRLRQFLNDYHQSRIVRKWNLSTNPEAFFGSDGRFWSYSPRRSTRSGTVVLKSTYPFSRTHRLRGPIRSIVPSDDQWIVQLDRKDTPLVRWDPASRQGVVDTAPYVLKGTLIGVTRDGRFLTRRRDRLLTYRQGKQVESRTFSTIKDVDVQANDVYVLTGNREVTRLDSRLTAQYTFFLPRERSYESLAVDGDSLYLTSPSGLYQGILDETGRSFFSQSTRVSLTTLARNFPLDTSIKPQHRLWVDKQEDGARVLVKSDTSMVRSVNFEDTSFYRPRLRYLNDLSRTSFQYFEVDSTYWRGEGSLYYFFKDDKAVEEYDTEGRLIKRRAFSFQGLGIYRDLQFLGANEDNVYFTARLIDSRRGFQRFILRYNWQGDLQRSFRLQHPFSGKEYMAPTEGGAWRYLGGENFYQLHSNSILVFDRYGYPRQSLSNVSNPVDLARSNGTLFVLDLGGKRLRAFDVPNHPSARLGLPSDLRIGALETNESQTTIVSGLSTGEQRLGLYEYDLESYEYQEVLSHPKQSLRYPLLADGGDSLFFWGVEPESNSWTLYNSDTVKYSARPLKRAKNVRGLGFYSTERELLFYPVKPTRDTGSQYRYTAPFGDTSGQLQNSQNLVDLIPGGFTGYYGVRKTADTYSIVSGYLDRKTETGPLQFNVADTFYRTSSRVLNLIPGPSDLYFVKRSYEGFSRLGRLSTRSSYSTDQLAEQSVRVNWLGIFRGYVNDYVQAADRNFLNLRTRHRTGRLYQFYPDRPPGTGGLQGQLTSSNPRELRGIKLRVDPGGQFLETERTGRFSFSDVPAGYVELDPPSYRHHFAYPVDIPIHAGEYTVKQSIPMESQEPLSLFEQGLKYFRQNQWGNARIPMKAFRDLIQDGPYYRWSDAYMEVVYREIGDTQAQLNLFERRPELFSAPELLELYKQTEDRENRRLILGTFRSVLDPYFRKMIQNELAVLTSRVDRSRRQSINRPLLSGQSRLLPYLHRPIRKIDLKQ